MGKKKRSNKKKNWSLVENVSKNSNSEKNSKPKEEKKNCDSDTLIAKNKLSHQTQSIKALSCESSSDKSNKPDPYVGSHNASANISSKMCKPTCVKPKSINNLSQSHKVKPVTLALFEKKDTISKDVYPIFSKSCFSSDSEEEHFDDSIKKDDNFRSKSCMKKEAPELLVKDFNDKLYLTDFLGDNSHESKEGVANDFFEPAFDKYQKSTNSKKKVKSVQSKSSIQKEASKLSVKDFNDKSHVTDFLGQDCYESDESVACDFFQPVFDEYQTKRISKNKNLRENFHAIHVKENYFDDNISSQAGSTTRSFDKYDLEQSESKLEFWSSMPSYSPETSNFDDKIELKEDISCYVDAYKNSKETFARVYQTWLPKRRSTLQKLKDLLSEVHNDQLNFNKSQVACKEIGVVARTAKNIDNQVLSFLGSFTAFLTDAACGVVSVAQTFNIDAYQSKFKEIMEEDAKITQHLYKERSNCVMKYQNIEEVMRKFHPDSFGTAISKISNSLEVNKYWKAMKEAYGNDNMPQLLDIVCQFLDNAFQPTKLEEVQDSVLSYVRDNPTALKACKSATQATYGYLDTWTLNQSPVPVLKEVSYAANQYLIAESMCEIDQLQEAIIEDSPQSKLEIQIEDAIDSLESDMKEINHTYYEMFKIYVDSNGSEWEISEIK